MLRRFTVSKQERAFLYQRGDYVRYVGPGTHWVFGFGWSARVARVSTIAFDVPDLAVLAKDHAAWTDLLVVDLRDHERGLLWVDGRLHSVLRPGRAAFWKVQSEVKVDVVDARSLRFEHESLTRALEVPGGQDALLACVVPPGSVGLLFVDEKIQSELAPGHYGFWKGLARTRVEVIDQREQTLEVNGQEILTKDRATIRLNLLLGYKVVAPRQWVSTSTDAKGALYHEVQLAARAAVAARTLDEVLAAKETLAVEVQAAVTRRAEALGAAVVGAGVKDVILPGDMRALVQHVLEAEKKAQAALITRREETAATRALLNTAKLYAEHPALLRLRELEAAERIAEKVKELRVAGLDEVVTRLLPGPGRSPQKVGPEGAA